MIKKIRNIKIKRNIHVLALRRSSVDCCVCIYIIYRIQTQNFYNTDKCLYVIKYSGFLWVRTVNIYFKNLHVCICRYIFCIILMDFSVINSEIFHCVWLCESANIVVINCSDLKLDHLLIKIKLILFTM